MPNTLAHIGVQTLVSRALLRDADVKWIWLACVIPDLPWILQRIARVFVTDASLIDIRLYAIVQSSLLFCLILSLGFASLSHLARRTFGILAGGVLFHLLLDATQTKWGNGVLLVAPLDWNVLNLGLYWPEGWPSYLLTLIGLIMAMALFWRERPGAAQFSNITPTRSLCAAAMLVTWIAGPLAFMAAAEQANVHDTATLRDTANRTGQPITFDRSRLVWTEDGSPRLHVWTGEVFVLDGADIPVGAGKASVQGTFVTAQRIKIDDLRIHSDGPREWFSYIGLFFVCFWWLWFGIKVLAR